MFDEALLEMTTETLTTASTPSYALMDVEAIQKALGRSRASIYRYANTDPDQLNLSYDPLLFHPTEVSRFARDILKIQQVTIQLQEPAVTATNQILQEILAELRSIRTLLENK
jgi:hypothetical protein